MLACSASAIDLVEVRAEEKNVSISINGENFSVPERITLKDALKYASIPFSHENAPRGVGGCWCCAVLVDGIAKPACITGVREGMVIDTRTEIEPRRVMTGFGPHMVGGVGTPK